MLNNNYYGTFQMDIKGYNFLLKGEEKEKGYHLCLIIIILADSY